MSEVTISKLRNVIEDNMNQTMAYIWGVQIQWNWSQGVEVFYVNRQKQGQRLDFFFNMQYFISLCIWNMTVRKIISGPCNLSHTVAISYSYSLYHRVMEALKSARNHINPGQREKKLGKCLQFPQVLKSNLGDHVGIWLCITWIRGTTPKPEPVLALTCLMWRII